VQLQRLLRPSTARRLGSWVLLGSVAVLVASLGFVLHRAREDLVVLSGQTMQTLAIASANAIEARTNGVEMTARVVASTIARHLDDPDFIRTLLADTVVAHPDIGGVAAAFEPGAIRGISGDFAPFLSQERTDPVVYRNLADGPGEYREATWYRHAAACPQGCWGSVFQSQTRRRLLINYGVPIHDDAGRAIGVVNVDVTQTWLQATVDKLGLGLASRAFVLDEQGVFLADATRDRIATPIAALAESTRTPALTEVARRMMAGETGSVTYDSPSLHELAQTFFAPVEGSKWSIAIVVPMSSIFRNTQDIFFDTVAVATVALALLGLFIWLAVRRMLSPLEELVEKAEHIARGEFEFRLDPPRRLDEVGRLTRSFIGMRDELKQHIAELTDATAARERLQSELDIAHRIQESMLPRDRHEQTGRGAFQLRALLRAAKTVGGDLYAYFVQRSGSVCFLIGDVSDKGVPAALFMARTITVAQTGAAHATRPDAMLRELNMELCHGNDSCMFVTALCGVLELDSGNLVLASAGHDPPIRIGADTAHASPIAVETGGPLGLEPDMDFPCTEITLAPQETLFLYTDGVTEARSPDDTLFGEARLMAALATCKDNAPDTVIETVAESVDAFARGAARSDDLTALALRWQGSGDAQSLSLALGAELADVATALDRIDAWLQESVVDIERRNDVRIALEELLVNTVSYGCEGIGDARIELALQRVASTLDVSIADNAMAFDPFAPADPDIEMHPDDREIGGLGIFLVRQLAAAYAYRRADGRNLVDLRFSLQSDPNATRNLE
jgi:sigma-B regulation protein RsbU (phosphoserine phosphatase)